jgi:hypothetical protein
MKFVHLLNSTLLVVILIFFLLHQIEVPVDIRNMSTIPEDLNIFQQLRVHFWFYAQYGGETFMAQRSTHVIAVAILLLNGILWPILALFGRKRRDRITLEVNGGLVSIKTLAIEESLRRSLKGDPQIRDSRVTVIPGNRKVTVTAKLKLLENDNLHHLDEKIIAHMKNHFERIFPIQKPVTFEVIIEKLKPAGTPMGIQPPVVAAPAPTPAPVVEPEPQPEPEPEPAPVKQPQYPEANSSDTRQDNKEE